MATISELNVRLGLLFKDFDKSLTAVEKRLERSGRKFSQLGNDLTLAISAPLAALGVSAIKQAGEIESLKLAMKSTFETAGRSAEDAAKEVEALRISAKAPGLDFEQAIKGSIRLQGVGIAAKDARKILEEMANAIALTGGTAEDLDGVTRQFSQMIAKGRVLQEDVSIIAERMPKISGLMQEAFGTASVEAIRKSGVTAQEFVDKITAAAAALPRVEGGIKNALVNAGAEARNSLAKLGEAINKAFDIPATLDSLTKRLAGAVEWFDSLTDSSKKTVVTLGAVLVAAGPVVKVFGVMQSTIAAGVGIVRSFTGGIKNLAGGVVNAASAFQKMDLVTKATVIGAVIASVVALYVAYETLSDNILAVKESTKALNAIEQTAAKSIAEEKVQADLLIKTIESETASREDKAAALNKLKQISPEYFGQLKEENGLVVGLKDAYNAYIDTLLKSAKVAAARERLIENEKELLDIAEQQEAAAQKADKAFSAAAKTGSILSVVPAAFGLFQKAEQSDLADRKKALEEQNKALAGFVTENDRATDSAGKFSKTIEKTTTATSGAADKAENMAKAYKKAITSIEAVDLKGDILGSEVLSEKAKEVESQVERLVEMGFGPNSKPIQNLKKYLTDIRGEISKGFGSANATQASVGASPAAPAALPSLALPQSVKLDTSGLDAGIQKAKELGASVESVADSFGRLNSQVSSTAVQLGSTWAEMKNGAMSFGDAITASAKVVQEKYGEIGNAIYGQVSEIANGILAIQSNNAEQEKARLDEQYASRIEAAQGSASAVAAIEEELAQKKAEIDKKVGKAKQRVAILQAIINTAQGVTSALGSAPPPYNFILAALTAAAGAVQIGVIKSQSFASGGVVSKPTYALMGEYPDASTNPEIISPEKKLRAVFRDEMGVNNAGTTELYSVIRGDDLLLISDKAAQRRGRIG